MFGILVNRLNQMVPKTRFIFVLVVWALLELGVGIGMVYWYHTVYEEDRTADATKLNIFFVALYMFLNSTCHYAFEAWVLEDGCFTVRCLPPSEMARAITWLTRFVGAAGWMLVCTYTSIRVVIAPDYQSYLRTNGLYVHGALMTVMDLMSELRSNNIPFFVHHLACTALILASTEFSSNPEPACIIYSIQLSWDKAVWLVLFFSRLKAAQEKTVAKIQKEKSEGEMEVAALPERSHQSEISGSSSVVYVPPEAVTSVSSAEPLHTPVVISSVDDDSNSEEVKEDDDGAGNAPFPVGVCPTSDVEEGHRHQQQHPFLTSRDLVQSFTSFYEHTTAKMLMDLSRKKEKENNINNSHGEQGKQQTTDSAYWVDDLIPTWKNLSRCYCFLFVYYAVIVRLLVASLIGVYLFRFWDNVSLYWKIVHPLSVVFFIGSDMNVYLLFWARSSWGGGKNKNY